MQKNILALTFFVLSSLSLASELQEESQDSPKLPVYVGIGYDLIKGNPLGKFVDTGFTHPIYNITYNNNQKTTDNRYIVPDNVINRLVTSCSFETDVKEHRGTQSYQKSIFESVSVKLQAQAKIFSAAFSTSQSWKQLQNQTINQKNSITMAQAECEAYYLSIDLYNHFSLDESFVNAVNTSFYNNDWDSFFLEYGTHFIHSVTMGGKAAQQIIYSSQAVSELSSLNIDISVAAKVRYAMFFGDTTVDWHKYENQVKYTEEFTNETSEIYIGGHPPKNGDIRTWVDSVLTNPMPIRYSLLQMGNIFDKIQVPSIKANITQIKQSFLNATNLYCQQSGCKDATPDKPKPSPANVQVHNAQAVGQSVGSAFEWKMPVPLIDVQKVLIRCGLWIDGIQLQMTDKVRSVYSPFYGSPTGGSPHEWPIPDGEELSQVEYWNDKDKLKGFNLVTNKGKKSPLYGRTTNNYTLVTFPAGYRVIGIYGNSSTFVGRFGFVLGRTTFSSTGQLSGGNQDIIETYLA